MVAASKLIGLYKDDKLKDVRTLNVVCVLQRLLPRVYWPKICGVISSHVQATQISVIKSGYEVSFYAMRKLINKA